MLADLQKCKHVVKSFLTRKYLDMTAYSGRQFISREELYRNGYSPYQIRNLVLHGDLRKIHQNYFENPNYSEDINDFNYVQIYAPKGIVCLVSAAVYHGLSTSRTLHIDAALPRNTRIPKSPEWPVIQYYLFSGERYSTGIETIEDDNNCFRIYDAEKTVCDILFYRNKLGFETAMEVLKTYLQREDCNINLLMDYAERLRCGKLLREYLEVIV